MELTGQWEGHICQELGLSVARRKGGERKSILGGEAMWSGKFSELRTEKSKQPQFPNSANQQVAGPKFEPRFA